MEDSWLWVYTSVGRMRRNRLWEREMAKQPRESDTLIDPWRILLSPQDLRGMPRLASRRRMIGEERERERQCEKERVRERRG